MAKAIPAKYFLLTQLIVRTPIQIPIDIWVAIFTYERPDSSKSGFTISSLLTGNKSIGVLVLEGDDSTNGEIAIGGTLLSVQFSFESAPHTLAPGVDHDIQIHYCIKCDCCGM